MSNIHNFSVNTIDGKSISLSEFRGKTLLIVNVASKCGYTPQYAELQKLYESYKNKGFEVLGFPANNFGAQEPGTNEEIKQFCAVNYDINFPLFAKISVKGHDKHPLYKFITEASDFKGEVEWNFQKYLVDKEGKVVAKFAASVTPYSKEILTAIEKTIRG